MKKSYFKKRSEYLGKLRKCKPSYGVRKEITDCFSEGTIKRGRPRGSRDLGDVNTLVNRDVFIGAYILKPKKIECFNYGQFIVYQLYLKDICRYI